MLRFLSVRHLAVIDRLEVDFEPGLNVLTGETGAGKSVLVLAIDLLVGGRASADVVRTGEELATIQAIFETPDQQDVIVRREISAQGRSRAFIGDALATATALRDLGASWLSLHGQHEHQSLMDPAEHVDLLDAFAGHADLLSAAGSRFDAWRAAVDALQRTQLSDREKQARIEIASFQLQEIEKTAPVSGEDDALAAEREVLANADRLSRLSAEAYASLYDGDTAALATLGAVWKRVGDLAALDPRAQPFVDQRDDIKSQLEDLAFFLRGYAERLDASPARLQAVEDRLAALERVKRRYGPALDDVIARAIALRADLESLGASEERAAVLATAEQETRTQFVAAAGLLGAARVKAARALGTALERDLKELAMPACRVDVRVTSLDNSDLWTRRGTDGVEFYFSPNPGEDVRPLARIASGGELSRFMLALRLLTVRDADAKTLIFDEVDAGIGGTAADAVGARLQALGRQSQVLCVTHLAQIAARADTHFEIVKHVRAGRTHTSVMKLDGADREREVGRMIAGAAVSPTVLKSARELLAEAQTNKKRNMHQPPHDRLNQKGPAAARSYVIETFGCQMNYHDSERIAGLLEHDGLVPASSDATADVVVLNTCSVRERAEEKLFTRLGELRELAKTNGRDPIIAVAGCVAQQEGERLVKRDASVDVVVGTQSIKQLPSLVAKVAERRRPVVDIKPYDDVSFPLGVAKPSDPVRAWVTIIEGCNEFCSFCVVPYTRGHERMRPVADILGEVRAAVESGRREVQLLGQIVNHYQAPDDAACDFPELLRRVAAVDGVRRLRFASPHPRHVSDRLIDAMCELPQVCRHLHLPVQSGSDRILKSMRRRYTRDDYLSLVDRVRDRLPDIALSTDVIVGFPGESATDFDLTMDLVRRAQFHSMYSFKYSARPNTLADKRLADDVPEAEKTSRIVEIQRLQTEVQTGLFARMAGTTLEVLVDGVSRRRSWEVTGRTSGNTVINLTGDASLIGQYVDVCVTGYGPNSLRGELVGATPHAARMETTLAD